MKKLVSSALFVAALTAASALAVPNLQIYIPGGEYDAATETWTTSETHHEVWVVASNLNHGDIYDIHLVASLINGEAPKDGGLSITDAASNTFNYDASDFTFGTPPTSDPMPGHRIFPTNYIELLVASVTTSGPFEQVQNYMPGGDGGTSIYGQIFRFSVVTNYDAVHYDAYGFYNDPCGKRIFAPFSHDGAYGVPEPATAVLFGFGLLGGGIIRKFRR